MDTIKRLRGRYYPLSNMYNKDIIVVYEGLEYTSSEAAFQSAKTLDLDKRKIFRNIDPILAKRMGSRVILRPDWEDIKLQVMYDVVKDKFTRNKDLGEFLMSTYPSIIEENNYHRDRFWGIYDDEGENHLGKILMTVRKEIMIMNGV